MKILITGAAGYIGGMIVEQFKEGPGVQIFAVDVRNQPKDLTHPRITWFVANLSSPNWFSILGGVKPDVVIHAAWSGTGNESMAANVFDYCVRDKINKFIHLSGIDGYGTPADTPSIENDPLRAHEGYGGEVVRAENAIKKLYSASGKHTQLFILRLPIVFGPRAWAREHFFATLGSFKGGGLPLVLARPNEIAFQVLHEDDLVDVVGLIAFNKLSDQYEVYNVAPDDTVSALGIGTTFGKKVITVSPAVQRLVPRSNTLRLTANILADSSKLLKKFKYKFNYSSYEALTTDEGRYGIEQN